jgi:AmmeMemoRadiSam system protein A
MKLIWNHGFIGIFLACILVWVPGDFNPFGKGPAFGREIRGHGPLKSEKEGAMAETRQLTEEEGRSLLSVARETIEQRLFDREKPSRSEEDYPAAFLERRGTFVTLTMEEALRGCIGHIIPQETLIEGIRVNAINAAFRDPRFRPLSKREWEKVKIEISILTSPQPLPYRDAEDLMQKLRPRVDGVIIKKGHAQATFLPQVWEQLADTKAFLGHLCMKAGLEEDAWKREKLDVSTYQVQAFEEE